MYCLILEEEVFSTIEEYFIIYKQDNLLSLLTIN